MRLSFWSSRKRGRVSFLSSARSGPPSQESFVEKVIQSAGFQAKTRPDPVFSGHLPNNLRRVRPAAVFGSEAGDH